MVVGSNQKIAYSGTFRRNGKAVYRFTKLPICKSIPHKGTEKKEMGLWRAMGNEEIVNLQNAEVTKMLDNKSEQK